MNATAKTAITRKTASAPVQYLLKESHFTSTLPSRILDYGCGKGKDAEVLECASYDPHFQPEMPKGKFEVILCTYVLNVVDEYRAYGILHRIQKKLKKNGIAYISVRRDIKRQYLPNELRTTKGVSSIQRFVELDLPIVYEKKGAFCIYKLTKEDKIYLQIDTVRQEVGEALGIDWEDIPRTKEEIWELLNNHIDTCMELIEKLKD